MCKAIFSTKSPQTLLSLFVFLALICMLVACASAGSTIASTPAGQASIPRVMFIVRDSSFNMPASLNAGFVDIVMLNQGSSAQQAQFARLKPGVALQALQSMVQHRQDAIMPLIIPCGGMLSVNPGQSQELILNMPAGQYVVLNFLPGEAMLSRTQHPLITPFTVTGPSNVSLVNPPRVDVKVTMRDFSFDEPDNMKSGLLTYQATNHGAQAHEMVFLKLQPGKTWRDVMAFLQSPQVKTLPGTVVGGLSALAPGETAWIRLNLAPGTYVILCFLPDKTSGLLHLQLGMICSITVK